MEVLGLENYFIAAGVRSAGSGLDTLVAFVSVLGRDAGGEDLLSCRLGVVAVSTWRQELVLMGSSVVQGACVRRALPLSFLVDCKCILEVFAVLVIQK